VFSLPACRQNAYGLMAPFLWFGIKARRVAYRRASGLLSAANATWPARCAWVAAGEEWGLVLIAIRVAPK
jgi:hypothetical protein